MKGTRIIHLKCRNGSRLELAEWCWLSICEPFTRFSGAAHSTPAEPANRDPNRPGEIAVLVIVPLCGGNGRDRRSRQKTWPSDGETFKLVIRSAIRDRSRSSVVERNAKGAAVRRNGYVRRASKQLPLRARIFLE